MDSYRTLRRLSIGAALVTVLAGSFAYTGVVTTGAFVAFVLVASAVSGLLTAVIGQPHQVGGLITGLGGAILWSVAVNALSGETSGPVARSSALCGVGAALAVYSARRLWVPPFIGSVVLVVCGAMYYGAAGEVRYVALVTALLTLVSTAAIDAARHRRRLRKPRLVAVLIGLLVTVAFVLASVGVQQALSRVLKSDQATVSALVQPESVRPPWAPPPRVRAKPPVSTTNPPVSTTRPPVSTAKPPEHTVQPETTVRRTTVPPPVTTKHHKRPLNLALIITLLLLAVLVLIIVLRLWLGSRRLRRWKRTLQLLPPAESSAASWSWMVFELDRLGWTLSENPSIDRAARDMLELGWPESVRVPAALVAEQGALASFGASEVSVLSATESWSLATVAVESARSSTKRWPRTRAVLRLLRT